MGKYYEGGVEVDIIYYEKLNQLLNNWDLSCEKITSISYIGICHSSIWDGGFDIEKCSDEEKGHFYSDFNEMTIFLKDFMFNMKVTKAIIGRFHRSRWFEQWSNLDEIDVYKKLKDTLPQYKLRNNSKNGLGIDVPKHQDIINLVIEGGFRYISCISIYFPEIGVLVEPTHNFELLFITKAFDLYKKQLFKILVKYKNLSLYEDTM